MNPGLSEHEARPGSANEPLDTNLPELSPEERKLVNLVMHQWHKDKTHRAKYDKNWLMYYRFFRGDQWTQKRPAYRHSEVINFVFQAIQSMVPVMLDSRPRPSFSPQDPSDLEFAEVLNDLIESDWQKGNWLFKLAEVIYDAHFYGVGLSSLKFDPDLDYGLGRIDFNSEDPVDCYPDGDARDINENCFTSSRFTTAIPMDVEKLRMKYAGHKYVGAIAPDLEDLGDDLRDKTSLGKTAFVQPTDLQTPVVRTMGGSNNDFGKSQKCLVITQWMKPLDTEQVEQRLKDDENSVTYITKKKYPKGRKVVIINGHPFEDGPLENDDYTFPFQRLVNYILPREFYGIAEVEQLVSPQRIFNKLISFTLDVLTLMGNPVWMIPTESGVKPGTFTNAPGQQIPYDGQQAPFREPGVQLNGSVLPLIDRMEQWFNGLSGSSDVSQGLTPGSVTAASAIETLQEAAQTRLRQKMRNVDSLLCQVGDQYVNLVLQHYTVSRVFRLTNDQGATKYFKFHVEPVEDENGPVIDEKGDPVRKGVVTGFVNDEALGRLVPGDKKEYMIRGMFDTKVSTESGLPFKKAEKENRLFQWVQAGIIDRRAFLEELDYPNREQILQRIEQAEQQAAMQGA